MKWYSEKSSPTFVFKPHPMHGSRSLVKCRFWEKKKLIDETGITSSRRQKRGGLEIGVLRKSPAQEDSVPRSLSHKQY